MPYSFHLTAQDGLIRFGKDNWLRRNFCQLESIDEIMGIIHGIDVLQSAPTCKQCEHSSAAHAEFFIARQTSVAMSFGQSTTIRSDDKWQMEILRNLLRCVQ